MSEVVAPVTATEPIAPVDPSAPSVDPAPLEPPKPTGTPAWVQPRIDQITREKHEAIRQADEFKRQLEEARRTTPPTPVIPPQQFTQEQITQAARQMREIEKFNENCQRTYDAGKKEHADFDQAVNNLKLLGGESPQYAMLIQAATNATDGHKVLHHLGNNMEEAQRLMSLSPIQLGIEMERVAGRVKALPKPSNAPPPVRPINGGGGDPGPGPDADGNFKSQEDYRKWRAAQRKQ